MPRRRCEGSTATAVTPATSARAPGTAMVKLYALAVATMLAWSNAARLRSASKVANSCCRAASLGAEELKACSATS